MAEIKKQPTFPYATVKRAMQAALPKEGRVSKEAIVELDSILAGIVKEYTGKAYAICANGKRVTVSSADVKLAFE